MIYYFKITSQESKNFHLEVEVDGKNTFFDFHTTIQQSLGFEPHQLASFFISDRTWRKYREISLLDLGLNGGVYLNMHKTRLTDLLKPENRQLIYTFDFFNDRSLYIELTGIIMERNLKEPTVTLKQGDAPVQVFGEEPEGPEAANLQEEEVFMDFGIVDDYTELFGEMEDI
ncbi:MAG: IS1096 element passenger TnpR family protein [Tangfeifania sp.]